MAMRQRRYSKEELARRGKELYESQIRQQVEANNFGKIVAIDIETGTFEVADYTLVASKSVTGTMPRCSNLVYSNWASWSSSLWLASVDRTSMITGVVNANGEAMLRIVVGDLYELREL